MKRLQRNLSTVLDMGTSKVTALVGEVSQETGEVHIIGYGSSPSEGMKRGMVVNIDATVSAVQKAVEQAEMMTEHEIKSVVVGISGSHIHSINSHGVVPIQEEEVSVYDIDRVIEAARAVAIPSDQKILHVLPQEFIVDGQTGIHEPIGISGVRLEAQVHIMTGLVSASQNLVKCIKRAGLMVNDVVVHPLASASAVLSADEKELGVCVVDIGAGTADIAIFIHGAIRHAQILPVAGDQVTNDVALALHLPSQYAEEVKIQYGQAMAHTLNSKDQAEVTLPGMQHTLKTVSRKLLSEVIQARYEELFSMVNEAITQQGLKNGLPAGIVLTGGASRLTQLLPLAESCFNLPVRLGTPFGIQGPEEVLKNPIHATACGLLLYAYRQKPVMEPERLPTYGKNILSRMKQWVQGNF